MQNQDGLLWKSENGGASSFPVATAVRGIPPGELKNWSTPVAMDPVNPDILYYGATKVYRSEDAAASWQAISPTLPVNASSSPKLGTITAIAIAPSDPEVVYAGTDDGRVWMSPDGRVSWLDVSEGLPERWVTRIGIDPNDPLVAYVTFSGLKWKDPQPHIFKTESAGLAWSDISSNLPDVPLNAVAVDPIDTNVLYVGSDLGVFASADGGDSWQPLADGMPLVAVYDLDIHADSRTLFASTHGRSIYKTELPTLAVSVESEIPSGPLQGAIEVWPNPFRSRVQFSAELEGAGIFVVSDILGRAVARIATAPSTRIGSSERLTAYWDGRAANGLMASPGLYLVRALTTDGRASDTATVIHLGDH